MKQGSVANRKRLKKLARSGGEARAANLTAERRIEIARMGAAVTNASHAKRQADAKSLKAADRDLAFLDEKVKA